MKYIIATKQGKKDTLTKPMVFPEAQALFTSITGESLTGMIEGEEVTIGSSTIRQAILPELVCKEEGTKWLDEIIDDFSDARFRVAYDRAVKEFGGIIADNEDEGFLAEYHEQLKRMAVEDLFDHYVEVGRLAIQRVDEEGCRHYASTTNPSEEIVHIFDII